MFSDGGAIVADLDSASDAVRDVITAGCTARIGLQDSRHLRSAGHQDHRIGGIRLNLLVMVNLGRQGQLIAAVRLRTRGVHLAEFVAMVQAWSADR